MNQALPRGTGALFAGGMEACWMVCGLWLLETRAAADALPVPSVMLGLPLAFTLWRVTRALSPSLRFSAGLAGAAVWALVLITFCDFPVDALTEPARVAGRAARLFQRQGAPNPIQLIALAAVATWVGGLRLAPTPVGFDRPPERVSVRPADPALHFLLRRAVGCCAAGHGDGGIRLFHVFSAGDDRGPGRRCRRLAAGQNAGSLARRPCFRRGPGLGGGAASDGGRHPRGVATGSRLP